MYNDYFFRILFARFALITKNSLNIYWGAKKKELNWKRFRDALFGGFLLSSSDSGFRGFWFRFVFDLALLLVFFWSTSRTSEQYRVSARTELLPQCAPLSIASAVDGDGDVGFARSCVRYGSVRSFTVSRGRHHKLREPKLARGGEQYTAHTERQRHRVRERERGGAGGSTRLPRTVCCWFSFRQTTRHQVTKRRSSDQPISTDQAEQPKILLPSTNLRYPARHTIASG